MKYKKLGNTSKYNLLISESLCAIDNEEFDISIKNINECLKMFPQNKEARFYKIIAKVMKFNASNDPMLYIDITNEINSFIKEHNWSSK